MQGNSNNMFFLLLLLMSNDGGGCGKGAFADNSLLFLLIFMCMCGGMGGNY